MNLPSDAEALEEDFWAYALALYDAPGVAAACLALQDEAGLDVNLLLLCCWLGARGYGALDAAGAARLRAHSEPWQREALAPLRSARRGLKVFVAADDRVGALHRDLSGLELRAERIAQASLIRALPSVRLAPPQDPRADAAASLSAYAGEALDAPARKCLLDAVTRAQR